MLSLIIAILFGLSITFFAFQNSILVPIMIGSFNIGNIPLYLVVIASLLLGIFMAWFISAMEGISHFFHIRQKDSVIHQDKKEKILLEKRIKDLEIENTKLKGVRKEVIIENAHEHVAENDIIDKPSVFQRIFPNSTRTYSKRV